MNWGARDVLVAGALMSALLAGLLNARRLIRNPPIRYTVMFLVTLVIAAIWIGLAVGGHG